MVTYGRGSGLVVSPDGVIDVLFLGLQSASLYSPVWACWSAGLLCGCRQRWAQY